MVGNTDESREGASAAWLARGRDRQARGSRRRFPRGVEGENSRPHARAMGCHYAGSRGGLSRPVRKDRGRAPSRRSAEAASGALEEFRKVKAEDMIGKAVRLRAKILAARGA